MRMDSAWITGAVTLLLSLGGCGKAAINSVGERHTDGSGDEQGRPADGPAEPTGADADAAGDRVGGEGATPGDAGSGDPSSGFTCTSCHGSALNAAPPIGLGGTTATTAIGVGAHQSHLRAATWHKPIACDECHRVPQTLGDPGHIDTSRPAEVLWGPLANTTPAVSSWNGTTCDTYCHGQTLAGGAHTQPAWVRVGAGEASCGSCHGLPPPAPHPAANGCGGCHAEVMAVDGLDFAAPEKHIDGVVQAARYHTDPDWALPTVHGTTFNAGQPSACTACHGAALTGGPVGGSCEACHSGWQRNCVFCHGGTDNQTGAPPAGVDGELARATLQVGAHTKHVADTALHVGRSCATCHVMPTEVFSAGHLDDAGRATVTPGGLASGTGYDATAGVCSNNYCHGNGQAGAAGRADWNLPGQLACAACHDDDTTAPDSFTMSGEHYKHVYEERYGCHECHAAVVNSAKAIVDLRLHVNGVRDLLLFQGGSWSATGNGGRGSCDPACHGAEPWYP